MIQTAFSEVADALAERMQLEERMDAQRAIVAAAQRGFSLSDARYRNGVDSYLVALDAQRTFYSAQQTLISLRLTEASNRVTLYKVLGGGADAQSAVVSTQAPAPTMQG
nr:TolC family protein [Xanthomonas vasicola]